MKSQRVIAESEHSGEFTMRAIIILILCSSVLISGSPLNPLIAEESVEHGLPANIEEERVSEVERQVREDKHGPENALPEVLGDTGDPEIEEISSEKREISASETNEIAPDKSPFESRTTSIFSNILLETRALMESARVALLNLRRELSVGPRIGEPYDENAISSESLSFTENEISSFLDRFPEMVRTLVDQPMGVGILRDMVTASVPSAQISESVGRLRNHIVELLQVIRERLANDPASSISVDTLERSIASLQAQRFQVLDDLVPRENGNRVVSRSSGSEPSESSAEPAGPSKSSASTETSPESTETSSASTGTSSASTRTSSASTETSSASTKKSSKSPKSDSKMKRKITSLRSLCSSLKSLLTELPHSFKQSLSSLHDKSGSGKKVKRHPIFSLPYFRGILTEPGETEGSELSTSALSPASSYSLDFGRANVPEAINSALVRASAAAHTLPDLARAAISPYIQGSSPSSPASSYSLNFGGANVPEVINSALVRASATAHTLPDVARAAISPYIQGLSSSSSASSNSVNFGGARTISVVEPSVGRSSSKRKACPICGLLSCLCHLKGHGYDSYLEPQQSSSSSHASSASSSSSKPSAFDRSDCDDYGRSNQFSSASAAASSRSFSDTSSPQIPYSRPQQEVCPICGHFPCICQPKGYGYGFYPSEQPSSETYYSSSKSGAASSASERGYISPGMMIPAGRSDASPSSRWATPSSFGSTEPGLTSRPQQKVCPICGHFPCICQHKGYDHGYYHFEKPSSGSYASSSASAAASSSASSSSSNSFDRPDCDDYSRSREFSSSDASAASDSFSDTSIRIQNSRRQEKACSICGLFPCICHHKGHDHGFHHFKKTHGASESVSRASSQGHKTCSLCGLFPCICHHKGHDHSFHHFKETSAVSESVSEVSTHEQKTCSLCGLFPCICHHKGHDHSFHLFKKPSATSGSVSEASTHEHKTCPLCGLFPCICHHKGHHHGLHHSKNTSAASESVSEASTQKQKTCHLCGLFPCLCHHKGYDHSFHHSKNASATSESVSEASTHEHKTCPLGGLFPCLGHHKGHDHGLHLFKKHSATSESASEASSPNQKTLIVKVEGYSPLHKHSYRRLGKCSKSRLLLRLQDDCVISEYPGGPYYIVPGRSNAISTASALSTASQDQTSPIGFYEVPPMTSYGPRGEFLSGSPSFAAAPSFSQIRNPSLGFYYPRLNKNQPNPESRTFDSSRPQSIPNRNTPQISSITPDFRVATPNFDAPGDSSRGAEGSNRDSSPFLDNVPSLSGDVSRFNSAGAPTTPLRGPKPTGNQPNPGSRTFGSSRAESIPNRNTPPIYSNTPDFRMATPNFDAPRDSSGGAENSDRNNSPFSGNVPNLSGDVPRFNSGGSPTTPARDPKKTGKRLKFGSRTLGSFWPKSNPNRNTPSISSITPDSRVATPDFHASGDSSGGAEASDRDSSPFLGNVPSLNGGVSRLNSDGSSKTPVRGPEGSSSDRKEFDELTSSGEEKEVVLGGGSRGSNYSGRDEDDDQYVRKPATYGLMRSALSDAHPPPDSAFEWGTSHYGGLDLREEYNEAKRQY